jgi:hypothetical protein
MACPYLFDNKHHGFTLTRVGMGGLLSNLFWFRTDVLGS